MNSRIRAILFDLDGTLADALADLADATNQALLQLDCPTHPVDAYRHFVGDGARILCSRVLPKDRQSLVDEAVGLMRQHYSEHCFDRTRLYPGVPELVAELRRRGAKLAVLSNKPDDFTKRMVAHYFQPSPFDLVCGQLPDVPLKPDPTAALRIAAALDVAPSEWLYLGDTNTDMRTARAAGMHAVGVLWGFRDRVELIENGAEKVISQPNDVLELMQAT